MRIAPPQAGQVSGSTSSMRPKSSAHRRAAPRGAAAPPARGMVIPELLLLALGFGMMWLVWWRMPRALPP